MKTRLLTFLIFIGSIVRFPTGMNAGVPPNQPANLSNVHGSNVTPSSPPSSPGTNAGWKANYLVTFAWFNYFTGCVTIQNTSTTPIRGWNLRWAYAGNQTVLSVCDGNALQSGKMVHVTNADCNQTIPPGGSVSFTFLACYTGTNVNPTVFALQ